MPRASPLDDPGAFAHAHALRDALPTRVHAEMLVRLVLDGLGAAAWTESYNDGSRRIVYRREVDPEDDAATEGLRAVFVSPVVSMDTRGRQATIVPIAGPEGGPFEPPMRPGRAPNLRNLGPGEILIHDGPHSVTITYGDDGRWKEITRGGPKEAFADTTAALQSRSANPVELVAAQLTDRVPARHGTARVHLPVAWRGGVKGVWNCGLHAIRRALWDGRLPDEVAWVMADGLTGRALAWGATRGEAFAAWRAEVERIRPWPDPAPPPPELPPKESVETDVDRDAGTLRGRMTLRGPSSDVENPAMTVENAPGALLRVDAPPSRPCPFGDWARLLGGNGRTFPAALRREPDGFTLLGDRLAAVLEFDELKTALAHADEDFDRWSVTPPPRPDGIPAPPPPDTRTRTYRLVDEHTGRAVRPTVASQSSGVGINSHLLDGARLRWLALRIRKLSD